MQLALDGVYQNFNNNIVIILEFVSIGVRSSLYKHTRTIVKERKRH